MKGDEDLGPDRGMDFETDDEENQAERVCEDSDDDDYESESDVTAPSRSASMHQNIDNPTWPQSYSNQCTMWNRTPFNTICTQTRRVVEPRHSLHLRYHYLLHWNSFETLFRNLFSSPNVPRYWTSGIWNPRSYIFICKSQTGYQFSISVILILLGRRVSSCVEYLIMMSDNLSALFPNANMNFSGIHLDSYQLCMITSTLVILPTVWLRNLSFLSVISVGGVFTAAAVSLCLLWVGVVDQVGFHPSGPAMDLAKLPVTLGLFGFCYGSHSVFPNIYSSMKEPSKFPSVLIISFSASCLLYAAVAICGFLMFGHSTKSQFTLNMPSGFVASKVAAWTTIVAPVTKYALTITPVAFSLEELLPSAMDRSYSISILIRTILVFSTLVVALTVPYFDSVMAFIGSSLVMLIALIFPCACYLSICRDRLTKLQIWVCILVMNVGLICAIIGTYSAMTTIGDEKV
ncbi:hypothetical protein RHMOL_Rhmol05G0271500 [Rhododendron molle]|uniref:Uncharacterized protein n=1 Tax=Rhododendron molle TaxID=49168 RepID=A0ACC0NUM5_RHOML|nr:hypothetical protein RHMOL_Rhmol05G0271500 [Rhododendron molle]